MIPVPTVKTIVTKQQALAALMDAWGQGLTRELARGLLSLVWIESGAGKLNNFNAGNISAGPSYAGKVWIPPWVAEPGPDTSARNIDLHAKMLKGQAPSAFRAYDSLSQGFSDFVAQLRHTFPEVIAATTGTPDGFRQALSLKYSHDYKNPAATNTFTQLWHDFDPVVALLPATPEVVPPLPLPDPPPGSGSESLEPWPSFSGIFPVLRYGSSDHGKFDGPVHYLQRILGNLLADGEFGIRTESAVKVFQTTNDLKADGVVGPVTWKALNESPKV